MASRRSSELGWICERAIETREGSLDQLGHARVPAVRQQPELGAALDLDQLGHLGEAIGGRERDEVGHDLALLEQVLEHAAARQLVELARTHLGERLSLDSLVAVDIELAEALAAAPREQTTGEREALALALELDAAACERAGRLGQIELALRRRAQLLVQLGLRGAAAAMRALAGLHLLGEAEAEREHQRRGGELAERHHRHASA